MVRLTKILRWLWFGKREIPRTPLLVNFPAGPIKLCFSHIEYPLYIAIWCLDNTIIGMSMQSVETEIRGELSMPAKAMAIMEGHDALLEQVYCGEMAMIRGPIPAEVFDAAKVDIIKVPRWLMLWERFQNLFKNNDDDYDDDDDGMEF